MSTPHKLDTARSASLEKYLRLSQEHSALRQRLIIDPFSMPPSLHSATSDASPISTSPTRMTSIRFSPSTSPSRSALSTTSTRSTTSPIRFPSSPTSAALSITASPTLTSSPPQPELEARLLELTHAMKATLTELLNCISLRHPSDVDDEGDAEFRSWVQARLMEKEMELKAFRKTQGRRRTSSMSDGSSFGPETLLTGGGEERCGRGSGM